MILTIACMANFMVIIDTSIVNVALPAMKAALGLSAADQQWVVNGAIGLAVLVTIATTATRHSHLVSPAAATVHGYHIALLISAAVSLAPVLLAFLLPSTTTRRNQFR